MSATYGRILHEIYAELFHIYVYQKEYELKDELAIDFTAEKENLRKSIVHYDSLWEEFRCLEATYRDVCASLYEPNGFAQSGIRVFGNERNGAGASVNKARELLK